MPKDFPTQREKAETTRIAPTAGGTVKENECTPPEQCDASLAETQRLMAAGERMKVVAKGLRRVSKCIQDLAAETLETPTLLPQAYVAEVFTKLDNTLVAPLIEYAENSK
jgi:hypothetical protein